MKAGKESSDLIMEKYLFLKETFFELKTINSDLHFLTSQTEDTVNNTLIKYPMLSRMTMSHKSNLILILVSILDPKVKPNIYTFLQELECNFRKIDWKIKIKIEDIKDFIIQIDNLKSNDNYKHLNDLRNKEYAHKSLKRLELNFSVQQTFVDQIITKVEEIIVYLGEALKLVTYGFNKPNYNTNVIKSLTAVD